MDTKTIQSWIDKEVRIKEEYIVKIVDEGGEYEYINASNGMKSVLEGREREIFKVKGDFYGIDLYRFRDKKNIKDLPEPTHQILISKEGDYPFFWESKYFEIVKV